MLPADPLLELEDELEDDELEPVLLEPPLLGFWVVSPPQEVIKKVSTKKRSLLFMGSPARYAYFYFYSRHIVY